MSDYWELSIKINPICADVVCDIFYSNFDCQGIVTAEEEYKDLELINSTDDVVKCYITAVTVNKEEIQHLFDSHKKRILDEKIFSEDIGSWEVSVKKQEIVDWSKKWKENWKPTKVSEHIVICPTWEEYQPEEGEIVVNLDPGNAFGTGTHETTQLCIEAIENYMPKGAFVADIGCGSGILAICAVKSGAKNAIAIDNDPIAVDTAFDNAVINNVEKQVAFYSATVEDIQNQHFDFVMANILHNVLAEIMPQLKQIMKRGAKLVLSGILKGKEGVVLDAIMCNNLKIVETSEKNNWLAYVVEKED